MKSERRLTLLLVEEIARSISCSAQSSIADLIVSTSIRLPGCRAWGRTCSARLHSRRASVRNGDVRPHSPSQSSYGGRSQRASSRPSQLFREQARHRPGRHQSSGRGHLGQFRISICGTRLQGRRGAHDDFLATSELSPAELFGLPRARVFQLTNEIAPTAQAVAGRTDRFG